MKFQQLGFNLHMKTHPRYQFSPLFVHTKRTRLGSIIGAMKEMRICHFLFIVLAASVTVRVTAVSSLEDLSCIVEYIIVGGGCAGGIVASRLAQAGKCVVLLERGKNDNYDVGASSDFGVDLSIPFWHFLANPFQNPEISRTIWLDTAWDNGMRGWDGFFPSDDNVPDASDSEFQYGFDIFGGGSTANAMVYNRGNENIFKSWGWDDAWATYDDLESIMGPFENSERVAAPEAFPTLQAFYDVLNWTSPTEGKLVANSDESLVGFYDKSISGGLRSSVPRKFFPASVRELGNLAILLECRVEKVLFQGRTATGVEYSNLVDGSGGHVLMAEKEIILSAGPYISPHLLMKSGVGPRDQLEQHGIEVVLESSGVGRNYRNHLFLPLVVFLKDGFSEKVLNPELTFNGGEFIGHYYSDKCLADGCDAPDMQTAFSYYSALGHYLPLPDLLATYAENGIAPDGLNTANLWTMLTQPDSSGHLELNPNEEYPRVHAAFLSEPRDVDRMVDGLKKMRAVAQSFPDVMEEVGISSVLETDEELAAYVKQYAMGQYHPAGTCKMGLRNEVINDIKSKQKSRSRSSKHGGSKTTAKTTKRKGESSKGTPDEKKPKKEMKSKTSKKNKTAKKGSSGRGEDDSLPVVDHDLKVHGIHGLRVVDSSVMPRIQNGNTAAPSMLIGYIAADLILGEV